MIAKQPAVKRYIVTLSADERERLYTLTQKGTCPARQVLKARSGVFFLSRSPLPARSGVLRRHNPVRQPAAAVAAPEAQPDQWKSFWGHRPRISG